MRLALGLGPWTSKTPAPSTSETSDSPKSIGLEPSSGPEQTPVTITGEGFGREQGRGSVRFDDVPAQVQTWNDTTITTSVPYGALIAAPRMVIVTAFDGSQHMASFTVTAPTS